MIHITHKCLMFMGGDLGELGAVPPKKIEVAGRPMHPSLQYFETTRSRVNGCVGKYELTKKV